MNEIKDNNRSCPFFGARSRALETINYALNDASTVRIATAYFEPSGYQCLREILRGKEIKLLVGRPDTGADKIREVIHDFMESLMTATANERTETMTELRDAIKNGLFLVRVSADGMKQTTMQTKYLYQHAKLYMSDRRKVVVTSANMTYHGLNTSREAGIIITDHDDVNYFVNHFDEYYVKAKPIAEELLEILDAWLRIYSPYIVYIRSLIDLYGLPADDVPESLPVLAGYQRPVVSRVLRNIEDYNGSMLIASTGLGKTIMAAHVVAYLRMKGDIDSAIIISPAGLRTMWRRTMRAAKITSIEFSYNNLSVDDWKKYAIVDELRWELKRANDRTIVILDESHHLRNESFAGELRLRNDRILELQKKGVKILLMTATPYSKNVQDINAQLKLLPPRNTHSQLLDGDHIEHWNVDKPARLSDTANCVVLTAPSVVRHFSYQDADHNRYVKFYGNDKRYFPVKIHMKNVDYHNPCDSYIICLLKSGLLRMDEGEEFSGSLFNDHLPGRRNPLWEAQLVHQFCSSVKESDRVMAKLEFSGGYEKIRFHNQEKLHDYVAQLRPELQFIMDTENTKHSDEKINKVIEVIVGHPKEKVVVFCHYQATSHYVRDTLQAVLKDKRIESTVEKKSNELEKIIRAFAPVANKIDVIDNSDDNNHVDDQIDILIATGSLTEGFNLQDASVLINYDLPWTVLVLSQRMGRILRPWSVPREIYIYNLIPSTMENNEIHLAFNWKNRLDHRNKELSSFTEIPVMVDRGSQFELFELSRSLNDFGDTDLNLDQVFEFIENTDNLQTTSFIDDLSFIDDETMKELKSLPHGIKSIKKGTVEHVSLYLLFQYKSSKRLYPALFDREGGIIKDSEHVDAIMHIIRSSKDENALLSEEIKGIDIWIDKCTNNWAAKRNILPEELTVICVLMLLP